MKAAQTILRRKQVEARTGLPRSTMYQRMAEGTFPQPISLGPRAVGWLDCEIDAWIHEQIEHSRPPEISAARPSLPQRRGEDDRSLPCHGAPQPVEGAVMTESTAADHISRIKAGRLVRGGQADRKNSRRYPTVGAGRMPS